MAEDSPARGQDRQPEDAELITRILGHDNDALSVIYDRYSRLVYSLAVRMVEKPELAEEVTQDVFMTLWRRGSSYKSERGPFTAWLLSITHNRCIDELRRLKRHSRYPTVELDEVANLLATHSDEVPGAVMTQLDREAILAAMEQLPVSQREVITMAYFQGFTQSEISEAMGAPLGTVKTRMRLGLHKLRDILVR